MRFVIQRVKEASVETEAGITGSCSNGFLILAGICEADDKETADKMIKKTVGLRIFTDENDKTNLSINDVKGSILLVSQFTLYADCRKGNRPSFVKAGSPEHAKEIYEYMIGEFTDKYGLKCDTGEFGAHMKVSLINDGPFTVVLDSDELFGGKA